MNRRTFLTASGLTFSVTVAGCLSEKPSVPAGMTVETSHWVADILEEGIWHHRETGQESINRYHQLIADAEAAQDQIDGDEAVDAFVRETDFEQSYLLVVQNIMQTARWLELGRIERGDAGLDVAVVTASPDEPYGDDAAAHSLAIRVTDEQAGIPAELHVTVDGEPTNT